MVEGRGPYCKANGGRKANQVQATRGGDIAERRLLLYLPSRPGSGPCCRLFSRCRLAARLWRGQPGPIPFRACLASRHLGGLLLAQMLTDFRFWIAP
jgi:hypothetical protein